VATLANQQAKRPSGVLPDRWQLTLRDRRATLRLGERFGAMLPPGAVLGLVGELGAGKTTFVQGVAKGVAVADLRQVLSPTYTLSNEYPGGRLLLVHMDFYRLEGADSARALGLEDTLGRVDTLAVVEWADRAPDLLPQGSIWMHFQYHPGELRRVQVQGCEPPTGFRWSELDPSVPGW